MTDPHQHHRLPITAPESLRLVVLIGIVLISPVVVNIMLVVHALGAALCLVFGLLAVEPVFSLGLG